jgi:lipopolysaccharide/colanic/teichoic acid biosynthesis glycosyltransferase
MSQNSTIAKLPAPEQPRRSPGIEADLRRLSSARQNVLGQQAFHSMLTLERRRAERSRDPFVLLLIDTQSLHLNGDRISFAERLTSAIFRATRETDVVGWYELSTTTLGIIFTETAPSEDVAVTEVLRSKILSVLEAALGQGIASKLVLSVHVFPQSAGGNDEHHSTQADLYSELSDKSSRKRGPIALKRAIDFLGSALLLLILSPILAVIALAIKLTSQGPVVFEQERMGQFGRTFKCLKFRTMYANNDPKIHREYVQNFIAGKAAGAEKVSGEPTVFKIKNDPRITPVGRVLRKTSLDELPQFWNVLVGDMSLVGPRPPVRYEFEVYDFWHRRRVLEVKPGVTGLWQVSGRSRLCFDDMVRLDLRYSQTWSLWLDLRILVATPRAVFSGDGAF